jgi:hypothetical protein
MQPVVGSGPKQTKAWWRRNWKWLLPASALGAAGLAVVLAFFGVIALIVVSALGTVRFSGACTAAITRAAADPVVVEALGSPIQKGWLVGGTLDPGRCADLTIPVSGPKGSATIHVKATCARCRGAIWPFDQEPPDAAKEWNLSALMVEVAATRGRITVIEDPTPGAPACDGHGLKRGRGWR